MNTLMKNARLTQEPILSLINAEKLKYTPFWVSNTIAVEQATESFVNLLAKRNDIDFIEANNDFPLDLGVPTQTTEDLGQDQPEWNVRWIGADQLWKKNITGTGFVVGVSDTGVHHTHPALIDSYRGKNGTTIKHDYNWFDGTPNRVPIPEDDNNHGTHCTGTAAGGRSGRKIGVAPGATWIHCRSMKISTRQWSPATFISCLQFFLAPTTVNGTHPNPNLRPHATSHSYGCSAALGCPDPNAMKPGSDALHAAGVGMLVSAGNSGPSCSSVNTQPGIYASVVAVGATGLNSDLLASFSSRGPVIYDRSNRLSPQICAPGVNVVSATRGGYSAMSGTSMSSPAVNGAIALFWHAVPKLSRKLNETMGILYKSAKHQESTLCNSTLKSPNNLFGWGTIQIDKAVVLAKDLGY